ASVPYLVSPHGSLDPWHRNQRRCRKAAAGRLFLDRMLASAAALHFTTEDEARLAAEVVPDVRHAVVPVGIDVGAFARLPPDDEFRSRYIAGSRGPVVLNIGRLSEKKGHDVLIEAFALAAGHLPDARLVLVGPDDEGLRAGL